MLLRVTPIIAFYLHEFLKVYSGVSDYCLVFKNSIMVNATICKIVDPGSNPSSRFK